MTVHVDESEPAQDALEKRAGERVEELQDENAQLQEAMRSHAVVGQAIGVILAVGHGTPDQGWDVLRGISRATNIKLRHVSELIIEWARTGQCADIRTELDQQLRQHAPPVRTDA
ncbi:ANTAR domain-containing protein [Streptomyces sp. NPDC006333]|uniref:ANTAR domain-containing protein n=1 Tax=Streptomyces sp. NPDC006333 TaxID=3156753 RepID=UPI0033B84443